MLEALVSFLKTHRTTFSPLTFSQQSRGSGSPGFWNSQPPTVLRCCWLFWEDLGFTPRKALGSCVTNGSCIVMRWGHLRLWQRKPEPPATAIKSYFYSALSPKWGALSGQRKRVNLSSRQMLLNCNGILVWQHGGLGPPCHPVVSTHSTQGALVEWTRRHMQHSYTDGFQCCCFGLFKSLKVFEPRFHFHNTISKD